MTPRFMFASAFIVALVAEVTSSLPAKAVILSTSTGVVETVNVTTGAVAPYSNSTGIPFFDIATSNTGNLFGVSSSSDLYSIAPSPGSSNLIGATGAFINGLGFDDNNKLFGTGGTGFYSINTGTGAATLVANIANFNSAGDIVFSPTGGVFYATSLSPNNSTLFSIKGTGAASPIGNIGFSDVFGLAFEGGNLYGYTSDGKQLSINLSSGAGTFSLNVAGANVSNQIFGAASSISQTTPTSVPEPFTIIGTLIGGTAAFRMRKKIKLAVK